MIDYLLWFFALWGVTGLLGYIWHYMRYGPAMPEDASKRLARVVATAARQLRAYADAWEDLEDWEREALGRMADYLDAERETQLR